MEFFRGGGFRGAKTLLHFSNLTSLVQGSETGETTIKLKFSLSEGGALGGREENRPKRCFFHGKRHDNKILKVQILLLRNFVVIAQAPKVLQTLYSKRQMHPFIP